MKAKAKIGLILLAAGESSRMGTAKQLLHYGGKPLVRHAAEVAVASYCHPVIVVLGAVPEAASAIDGLPVLTVTNPDWALGMGTSIQAGLGALKAHNMDGVILTLADQPLVTAAHLFHLVTTQRKTNQSIVASEYARTVGIPALFMRPVFEDLNALRPDEGCKRVIQAHRETAGFLPCPEAEHDIDTPEDFAALAVRAQRSA